MYLNKAKERFAILQERQGFNGSLRPCTLDDVEALSTQLNLKLPDSYIEFLLWTGNGGGCFGGHEFDCGRVGGVNKVNAHNLLAYYNKLNELPDDAIVIIFYQGGYEFVFIRISEGNNPPVHRVLETETGLQITWNFSANIEEHCLKTIEYLISVYQ
jgi:SMI1-KNR4 cell-wall